MFSRMIRPTVVGVTSVVLMALVSGCSNDNTVDPTGSIKDLFSKSAVSDARSLDDMTANSGAPGEGTVIEGESVPGIALGYTRAQVEAAYGDPIWCQNVNGYDRGSCAFPVEGGGQVDVLYRGANGGPANDSPDDVVYFITWYESVPRWITTAGITTTLAADDPEAVIAAYPDADITYTQYGGLYSVIDYRRGIRVLWVPDFYRGTTHVYMSISFPGDPPPPPENLLRVTDIDLYASKVRGHRRVQAFVRIRNQFGQSISGATAFANWTFPDGSTQAVEDVTSGSGLAYFEMVDVPRGDYVFTVDDVVLENYEFDRDNSVLNASVNVK